MDKLRAAVVGCGWAGALHAQAYKRNPRVELVAVSDPLVERSQSIAAEAGCKVYRSHAEMLAVEKPDVVSVASPTETHAAIGLECLQAGVAVFSEKPLTRKSEEARRLVEFAQKSGLALGVNYNRRFAAGYRRARDLLMNGGRIRYLSATLAQNVPLAQTAELRARLPHDFLLFDACSHLLDLFRYLAGEVNAVQAMAHEAVPGQLWTDIQISLCFQSGALGSILCSLAGPEWGQLPIERLEAATDDRRVIVENIAQAVEWFSFKEDVLHRWNPGVFEPIGYIDSIFASVDAWVETIFSKSRELVADGRDGLVVVELCEQIGQLLEGRSGETRRGDIDAAAL